MSTISAPKLAESIRAVTVPVELPTLLPRRGKYLAGVITGGALGTLAIVLLTIGLAVLS